MIAAGSKALRSAAGVLLVGAILGFGVFAVAGVPSSAATQDPVTFYLSNGTATDSACVAPSPGIAAAGSLESTNPATASFGSPSPSSEYCTSTSGAYAGPTLSVTSVSVTLYAGTYTGNIINVNGSEVYQPGGTIASTGPATSDIWSTTSCSAVTFSLTVAGGAQLTAGDVQFSIAFAILGSPSAGGPAAICTGGTTPSSITITGTTGTSSSSSSSTTSSSTAPPGSSGNTCTVNSHGEYFLDLTHSPHPINGPVKSGLGTAVNQNLFHVDNFSWSLSSGSGGTGLGAPKAQVSSFNVSMPTTQETPLIVGAAVSGQVFSHVYFYVIGTTGHGPGTAACVFLKIDLSNAMIIHYSIDGTAPQVPEDHLAFSFSSLSMLANGNAVKVN